MASATDANPEVKVFWDKYDLTARHTLRGICLPAKGHNISQLSEDQATEIRGIVDDLEKSSEFHAFVEALRTLISAAKYHNGNASFWEHAIANGLRRSGYYSNLAIGRTTKSSVALKRLMKAFTPHRVTVTYLAPMEYLYLEASPVACRTFAIRKFTSTELDKILETARCKLFYPDAITDTGFLCNYSFLTLKETRALNPIGKININLGAVGKVNLRYCSHPVIEKALYRLALYQWLPDWNSESAPLTKKGSAGDWKGWLGFKIPFVIQVSNSILDRPASIPNLARLHTEPYCHPSTGEEIGEKPSQWITLDEKQTQMLQKCLIRVDKMLTNVEPFGSSWPFLMRGLGFLVKGYFSEGLEQILWHITALEAMFGEKRSGLTQLMTRRVAAVLGETDDQKKLIKKHFQELYDLRSKLVHGSEISEDIWDGSVKDAREFARCSLLWFLSFLESIAKTGKHSTSTSLPTREEILAVIDSRPEAIVRLAKLLQSAPSSFPAVKTWQEPWEN